MRFRNASAMAGLTIAISATFLMIARPCNSQVFILNSGTTFAAVDPSSPRGLYAFDVYGYATVDQQWLWYRIGTNREQSIDRIAAPLVLQGSTNQARIIFRNQQLSISVEYLLTGSEGTDYPGYGTLTKSVSITNLTTSQLDFHLFELTHGAPDGFQPRNTVYVFTNLHGAFDAETIVQGSKGFFDEYLFPAANRAEAAVFNETLVKLNDDIATDLDRVPGPVGTGDITAALQWDLKIPASTSSSNYTEVSIGAISQSSALEPGLYLPPILDQTVSAEHLLILTNHVSGAIAYTNYVLLPDAPVGATLGQSSGIFRWKPSIQQAGSSNLITFDVRDMVRGGPRRSFRVIVKDYAEFKAGQINLSTGETGLVPLTLFSSAPSTNVTVVLAVPPDSLTDLELTQLAPAVGNASISPLSNNLRELTFSAMPNQTFQGSQILAQLRVSANSDERTAAVPLELSALTVLTTGGDSVADANTVPGRVVVIGAKPWIEAVPGPLPTLNIYARTGITYSVEYQTDLQSVLPWIELTRFVATNRISQVPASNAPAPAVFYRVLKR